MLNVIKLPETKGLNTHACDQSGQLHINKQIAWVNDWTKDARLFTNRQDFYQVKKLLYLRSKLLPVNQLSAVAPLLLQAWRFLKPPQTSWGIVLKQRSYSLSFWTRAVELTNLSSPPQNEAYPDISCILFSVSQSNTTSVSLDVDSIYFYCFLNLANLHWCESKHNNIVPLNHSQCCTVYLLHLQRVKNWRGWKWN